MRRVAEQRGVCKVSDSEMVESIRLKNQPVRAGLLGFEVESLPLLGWEEVSGFAGRSG